MKAFKVIYSTVLIAVTAVIICLSLASRFGMTIHSGRLSFGTSDKLETSNMEKVVKNLDPFTDIEIDADAVKVEICTGDTYAVECVSDVATVDYSIVNNKLLVKVDYKVHGFGDFRAMTSAGKVTIYVPESAELGDVKIDVDAGDITINNIKASNLVVEADAGNIEMENIAADKLDIAANAGSIELIKSSAASVIMSTDAGSIDIKESTLSNVEMETSMGSIDVRKSSFDFGKFSADLGSIAVSAQIGEMRAECSLGSIEVTTDSTDAKFSLETDMGSVVVNGKSCGGSYKN